MVLNTGLPEFWIRLSHSLVHASNAAVPRNLFGHEFGVTEDKAREKLGVICDGRHVEKVFPGKYAILRWCERDEPGGRRIGVIGITLLPHNPFMD
jgi:hypothetical protein